MKKTFVIILIVILCIGCFAACSTQQNTDTDVEPTIKKSEDNGTVLTEKESSPLVGCWVCEENGEKYVMQFFSNGKMISASCVNKLYWKKDSCMEYCTDANVLLMDSSIVEYSVNGEELTIIKINAYGNTTSQTFTKWEKGMVDYIREWQSEEVIPSATSKPSATRKPTNSGETDATPMPTWVPATEPPHFW